MRNLRALIGGRQERGESMSPLYPTFRPQKCWHGAQNFRKEGFMYWGRAAWKTGVVGALSTFGGERASVIRFLEDDHNQNWG